MHAATFVNLPEYPLHNWVNLFRTLRDRLGFLEAMARRGDLVRARIGLTWVCYVNHPELIREVLVTNARLLQKGQVLQRSKRLLGEGLLTSEGEHHHRQRRLLQSGFARQRLLTYGTVIVEFAERYAESLRPGELRAIDGDMLHLTLAIVGKTFFNRNFEHQSAEIGRALASFMRELPFLMLPGIQYLERLPLPQVRRVREAIKTLDQIIYQMIAERRQDGRDQGDLLSMMISARDEHGDGGGMTDKQLRDECITMVLAGHETTCNALTWTLYLLSQHPAVEAQLHAELDAVLNGNPPTPADLPRLPYTEKVFAESLRLFPPAWIMARQLLEPLHLGEHTVPKDCLVVLSPWAVHHDPRWFPDPYRFDPERFSPEAKAARHRFAFFPFSVGPRNCIGEGFAWTEAVLVLASLARRWKFRLAADQKVVPQPIFTLQPKYGMRMHVHPR